MPSFCRHNRLLQNCSICAREQSIEARPVVSSSAPAVSRPRPAAPARPAGQGKPRRGERRGSTVRVSRLDRGGDDGHRSELAPGLKSSLEAERFADELAFAAARLELLASEPPDLLAEIADPAGDPEERAWLAFLVAYLGPLDGDAPFAAIESVRTPWGEVPELDGVEVGPRGSYAPARGTQTIEAYRSWAARSGSQAAGYRGDGAWTAERRFARVFERLALPGLTRDARFELLTLLGTLGVDELAAGSLHFGGDNSVTIAAKRAFGIGDPLLLDRRAAALADGAELPLAALDLALFNWERRARTGGVATEGIGEERWRPAARQALQLESEPEPDGDPDAGPETELPAGPEMDAEAD